jgi:hypothetical protein
MSNIDRMNTECRTGGENVEYRSDEHRTPNVDRGMSYYYVTHFDIQYSIFIIRNSSLLFPALPMGRDVADAPLAPYLTTPSGSMRMVLD